MAKRAEAAVEAIEAAHEADELALVEKSIKGEDDGEPEPSGEEPGQDDAGEAADGAGKGDKPAGKDKPAKQRMVPHEAMHAERIARQQAERQWASERQENEAYKTRMDERLRILSEALTPTPQEDYPPDPTKDIFGYVEWQNRRMEAQGRQLAEFGQYQTQQQQAAAAQQQQAAVDQQFRSAYVADAQSFAADTPDFSAAYQFLMNSRLQELTMAGYDRMAAAQALKQDEMALAWQAMQAGRSPSEVLYNLARGRGYAPAKPSPSNGQGADKVRRLAEAQEATDTLSRGGSASTGNGKLTLESLDKMTEAEFNAFVKKTNAKNPNGMDDLMRRLELGPRK